MKFQISEKRNANVLKCLLLLIGFENISWILCCVALCALPNSQQTCASIATVCEFIIDKTGYILHVLKIE